MKALLTVIALSATVISLPAMAGTGCRDGEPLNAATKATNCRNMNFGTAAAAPMPSVAPSAFAYAPPRRTIVRRALIEDDLDKELRLKGGAGD